MRRIVTELKGRVKAKQEVVWTLQHQLDQKNEELECEKKTTERLERRLQVLEGSQSRQ